MRVQDGRARGRGPRPRTRSRGEFQGAARRDSAPLKKEIDVPKEDYDFESANAKFNKKDVVKEATTGDAVGSPVNGANGGDLAEKTNGHGEEEVVIPSAPGDKGYDKKSSFFDNISSDLKDREERNGVDGRAMRAEERTRNLDTFGLGSVDNGGYRGGFRGRGRARGFRGGQRGGIEGRGRGRGGAEAAAPV